MNRKGHETIEHTADMGIRGWGENIETAFEEAAMAMAGLMADIGQLRIQRRIELECSEPELEDLLIEFLNRLLSQIDIEESVCIGINVLSIEHLGGSYCLKAIAGCIKREEAKGRLLVEVKAATYCGVRVALLESGIWEAVCVVDI